MRNDNDINQGIARERTEAMKKLLDAGMTFQFVAEIYGVSRQRIHQLVRKHFPEQTRRRGK